MGASWKAPSIGAAVVLSMLCGRPAPCAGKPAASCASHGAGISTRYAAGRDARLCRGQRAVTERDPDLGRQTTPSLCSHVFRTGRPTTSKPRPGADNIPTSGNWKCPPLRRWVSRCLTAPIGAESLIPPALGSLANEATPHGEAEANS